MKCPYKTAAFDRPDECQDDCAWLVDDACSNDSPHRLCAVTAIAEALSESNGGQILGESAGPSIFTTVNDLVGSLLERQAAAIRAEDERICDECEWPSLSGVTDKESRELIIELQGRINVMKAERAMLERRIEDLAGQLEAINAVLEGGGGNEIN